MKDRILEILIQNKKHVSGEQISKELSVSRAAVWKAVKTLRQMGYPICARTKKGYILDPIADVLTEKGVGRSMYDGDLIFLYETDSTNTYLKELARRESAKEGTCVFCEIQKAGRGRLGRKWYSKPFSNISMSVLIKPDVAPPLAPGYSILAGVCVVEALSKLTNASLRIKWPNDILAGDKKICGILTEMDAEAQRVDFIVIGIGINVYPSDEGLADEIKDRAVSLKEVSDVLDFPKRVDIIRTVLDKLQAMYENNKRGIACDVIDKWREYSDAAGKSIRFCEDGNYIDGVIKDLDRDGALIVDTVYGEKKISSGMIFEIKDVKGVDLNGE